MLCENCFVGSMDCSSQNLSSTEPIDPIDPVFTLCRASRAMGLLPVISRPPNGEAKKRLKDLETELSQLQAEEVGCLVTNIVAGFVEMPLTG